MRMGVVVFRYDLGAYTNAGETQEIRLATAVRCAGGFDDLGSGIGESNATAAGGFEDLGSGMGESRTIEVEGSRVLDIVPAEKTTARASVRDAKCGFSSIRERPAEFNGAPETSNPKVDNESMIT